MLNTKDFKERFMQLISGQMDLPQSVFRQFLEWLDERFNSETALKQNATDNNLETTDKTVVGAINEVKTTAATAAVAANAALPAANFTFDSDNNAMYLVIGDRTYKFSATDETDVTVDDTQEES